MSLVGNSRGSQSIQPAAGPERPNDPFFTRTVEREEANPAETIRLYGSGVLLRDLPPTEERREWQRRITTPRGCRVLAESIGTTQHLQFGTPDQMVMTADPDAPMEMGEDGMVIRPETKVLPKHNEISGRLLDKLLAVEKRYVAGNVRKHEERWSVVDPNYVPYELVLQADIRQLEKKGKYVEHLKAQLDGSYAIFHVNDSLPNPYDSRLAGEMILVDVLRGNDAHPSTSLVVRTTASGEQDFRMLSMAGDVEYARIVSELGGSQKKAEQTLDALIEATRLLLRTPHEMGDDEDMDIDTTRFSDDNQVDHMVRSCLRDYISCTDTDPLAMAALFRASILYSKLSKYESAHTVLNKKGKAEVPADVAQLIAEQKREIRKEVSQSISDMNTRNAIRDLTSESGFDLTRCVIRTVDKADIEFLNRMKLRYPGNAKIAEAVAEYADYKDIRLLASATEGNELGYKFDFAEDFDIAPRVGFPAGAEFPVSGGNGIFADEIAKSIYERESHTGELAMRGVVTVLQVQEGPNMPKPETFVVVDLNKAPACLAENINNLFSTREESYNFRGDYARRKLAVLMQRTSRNKVALIKTKDGVVTYEGEAQEGGAIALVAKPDGEAILVPGVLQKVAPPAAVGEVATAGLLGKLAGGLKPSKKKPAEPQYTATKIELQGIEPGSREIMCVAVSEGAVCVRETEGMPGTAPALVMHSSPDNEHNPRRIRRALREGVM